MKYVSCLLFSACVTSLAVATTQADEFVDEIFAPRGGWYVAGTVGQTLEFNIIGNEVTASSNELSYDMAGDLAAYTGSIGSYFGAARIELEVGIRDATFDKFNSGITGLTLDVNGDLEYLTIMGNVFFDFPTPVQNLDFYLGGGAGLAIIQGDLTFTPAITISDGLGNSATTTRYNDRTHAFTYQFMAGLGYNITNNVAVTGGYRIRFISENSDDVSLLVFREHNVQAFEFGLRISF